MRYEEGIRVTLYFDKAVIEKLQAEAKSQDCSPSRLANRLINDGLSESVTLAPDVMAHLKKHATALGAQPNKLASMGLRQYLGMVPYE